MRGVLDAYSSAIRQVLLAGPTLFTPVIHTACEFAGREPSAPGAQAYYVLLIITDGVINDMASTIGAIVHASRLPLSILIVGVGGADFSAMDVSLFLLNCVGFEAFSVLYGAVCDFIAYWAIQKHAMQTLIVGVGAADFLATNVSSLL